VNRSRKSFIIATDLQPCLQFNEYNLAAKRFSVIFRLQ